MKNLINLMLCITFFFTGCKKDGVPTPTPDYSKYYGSRTANFGAVQFLVESKIGVRTGSYANKPFSKVVLMNGIYYFASEDKVLNDAIVKELLSADFRLNTTWGDLMAEASPALQDARYGKRYWALGTTPYAFTGVWDYGLQLVQVEPKGGLAILVVYY